MFPSLKPQILVPLLFTTLNSNHLPYLRAVFTELMHMATFTVEFSFNYVVYRRFDGVAMGSPLGPALAIIFVGNYEGKLFKRVSNPLMYCR